MYNAYKRNDPTQDPKGGTLLNDIEKILDDLLAFASTLELPELDFDIPELDFDDIPELDLTMPEINFDDFPELDFDDIPELDNVLL